MQSSVRHYLEQQWTTGATATVSMASRPSSIWKDATNGLNALMLAAAYEDGPCSSETGCSASCALLQALLNLYQLEQALLLNVLDQPYTCGLSSVRSGVGIGVLAVCSGKCDGCLRIVVDAMWQEGLLRNAHAAAAIRESKRGKPPVEFMSMKSHLPHFRAIWLAAKSRGRETVVSQLESLIGDTVQPGVAVVRVWSPRAGDRSNFGIYDPGSGVGHSSLMYSLPGESRGPNARIHYVSHWPQQSIETKKLFLTQMFRGVASKRCRSYTQALCNDLQSEGAGLLGDTEQKDDSKNVVRYALKWGSRSICAMRWPELLVSQPIPMPPPRNRNVHICRTHQAARTSKRLAGASVLVGHR